MVVVNGYLHICPSFGQAKGGMEKYPWINKWLEGYFKLFLLF